METTIKRVLEFLAGNGDSRIRQELRRPDSDASRILRSIQAKASDAHRVDLAAAARAVIQPAEEKPIAPPSESEASRPSVLGSIGLCGEGGCGHGVGSATGRPLVFHGTVAAATVTTVARLYSIRLTGRDRDAPTISGRIEWLPDSDSLGGETQRWLFMLRFPRRAMQRATENRTEALEYFDKRKVCVHVSGPACEERRTAQLHFDHNGDLVSAQEQMTLPQPLTEMKQIGVVEMPCRQPTSATVAFPWVGQLLPDFRRFERPADFVEAVDRNPPDWIFHLEISQTEKPTSSSFRPVSDIELTRLVDRLRLRMLEGPAFGYCLQPREFVFGNEPKRGHGSDYAFSLPSIVMGDSYSLALIVGLVAATTGQTVPSWVLFSGGVHTNSLDLTQIGCISRKLRLALDMGEQRGSHEALLGEFFRQEETSRYLGQQEDRTIPGKVKLCFVPTDLDAPLGDLPLPFVVEPIPDGVEALRQAASSQLCETVDDLREDGMLVVQASNAFEVLGLLGYDKQHPYIREERCRYAAPFPSRVYRVRHEVSRRCQAAATLDVACQAPQGREFWGHLIAAELDGLDESLLGIENSVDRLQIILDRTLAAVIHDGNAEETPMLPAEAEHFTGDISVIDAEDQPGRWLRVVATSGRNGGCLPYFVPRDVGLVGRVMRNGKTTVVPVASQDPDLQSAISAENLLATRYGYESLHRYQAFLGSVRCSLHVPLKRGSQVVGVVSLYCHRHKEFEAVGVRLVEKLARQAAVEVAFYLGSQNCTSIPLEGPGSNKELARRIAICGGQPEAALKELCHGLMSVIVRQTGAYRVGVRLLSPERHSLVDQGHLGYCADSDLAKEVLLSEDTAGCYAVKSGKSYFINDTTQAYTEEHGQCVPVHYKPRQPEARSHASVLVRHGSHLMGVVGVDWDRPGVIDTSTRQTLEQLADRYAIALKAFSVDSLWNLVYSQTPEDSKGGTVPDLNALLDAFSHMVGAQQGAIFLRRADTGRYHLVASMNHRDWSGDECWYEPGEGVTGWVIHYNRPLRVANLKDSSELRAIHPTDPPVWKDKVYDGLVRNDRNWTYLGVPIAVGNEVLGVLRLANGINDLGFSSYEQVVAMAAAAQLAGPLYERENARRASVLEAATNSVLLAESEQAVADATLSAVKLGLGSCACAVLSVTSSEDKDPQLSCRASNDLIWNESFGQRRQGEGICGQVWEKGTTLLFQEQTGLDIGSILQQEPAEARFDRFESGMCVPLRVGKEVSGTLLVCRETRRALTPGDCTFIERIAQLAGHGYRLARERSTASQSR